MISSEFDVTHEAMDAALAEFGFARDAILLTHSSLKSLGRIEGGAEGVIDALWRAVPDGTLVFPTLSSKNWKTVFEDWHLERPSDVGLISETFRTHKGSLRSDNATHSVAARGKDAADIVSGPSDKGARYGLYGFYSFSHYSPWQKMFESRERYGVRAYVLFWGVSMTYNTYKHFVEYRFVEELLDNIKDPDKKAALKAYIHTYDSPDKGRTEETIHWPFYDSGRFEETLLNEGIAKRVRLGNGYLIACDIYEMVTRTDRAMREDTDGMLCPHMADWARRARASAK